MAFERDKDPAFLRKAAGLLESENRRLLQQVIDLRERVKVLEGQEPTQLAIQNEELQRQLALRNKKIFGKSSEKRAHSGLGDKDQSAPQTGHGPREQTQLDIVVRVHELDIADRACPQCGGALQAWDGQFEEAEVIDVVERRYTRVLHKRQKYRCGCGSCIETALGDDRLIPGGRYSVGFAVHIGIAKYADHLPLDRQTKIMRRLGLRVEMLNVRISPRRGHSDRCRAEE